MMTKKLLLHYGCEGGGASVYQLPDNTVIETGHSGGLMDEEDEYTEWEKTFDRWEDWWQHYVDSHQSMWICFSPLYIHNDVKPFIKKAVDGYTNSDEDYSFHIRRWNDSLEEEV